MVWLCLGIGILVKWDWWFTIIQCIKIIQLWGLAIYFFSKHLREDKELLQFMIIKVKWTTSAFQQASLIALQGQTYSLPSKIWAESYSYHSNGCKPLQGKETMESISCWRKYVLKGMSAPVLVPCERNAWHPRKSVPCKINCLHLLFIDEFANVKTVIHARRWNEIKLHVVERPVMVECRLACKNKITSSLSHAKKINILINWFNELMTWFAVE